MSKFSSQFCIYPIVFSLLLFSGSILNGKDFNPCPSSLTLGKDITKTTSVGSIPYIHTSDCGSSYTIDFGFSGDTECYPIVIVKGDPQGNEYAYEYFQIEYVENGVVGADTKDIPIDIILSRDNIVSEEDMSIWSGEVPSNELIISQLYVGDVDEEFTYSEFTISIDNVPNGIWNVFVVIDKDNGVSESNESNNYLQTGQIAIENYQPGKINCPDSFYKNGSEYFLVDHVKGNGTYYHDGGGGYRCQCHYERDLNDYDPEYPFPFFDASWRMSIFGHDFSKYCENPLNEDDIIQGFSYISKNVNLEIVAWNSGLSEEFFLSSFNNLSGIALGRSESCIEWTCESEVNTNVVPSQLSVTGDAISFNFVCEGSSEVSRFTINNASLKSYEFEFELRIDDFVGDISLSSTTAAANTATDIEITYLALGNKNDNVIDGYLDLIFEDTILTKDIYFLRSFGNIEVSPVVTMQLDSDGKAKDTIFLSSSKGVIQILNISDNSSNFTFEFLDGDCLEEGEPLGIIATYLGDAGNDRATTLTIENNGSTPIIEVEVVIESQALSLDVFDANPKFISTGFLGLGKVDNIREISEEEDLDGAVRMVRTAVSCDGVSEVLLRAQVPEGAGFAIWKMEQSNHGIIERPWASRPVSIAGQDYVYALYTPPGTLSGIDAKKNSDGILSAIIPISFQYENEGELISKAYNIELVAPPVVLVHGTFDDPDNCWRTPLNGSTSRTLPFILEIEGFKVSTVDYRGSNGTHDGGFLANDPSSFEANKHVVYSNKGGIKEAIDTYRSDYKIAATRADVVGHSMGGVLPRVYAATEDYKRPDNFNAGDIHRLITIAATHHGSDLGYFGHFFNKAWSDTELPLQERLAGAAFSYGQWIMSGKAETAAIRDQLPASAALRAIGATEIPSHAIVCYVDEFEDIRNDEGDQVSNHYKDLFEGLASIFYYFPGGISGFLRNLIKDYTKYPVSRDSLITKSFIEGYDKQRLVAARRGAEYDEFAEEVSDLFSNQWRDWQVLMDKEESTWIVDEVRYVLDPALTESNYFDTEDNARDYIADRLYEYIRGEKLQAALDVNTSVEDRDKVIDYLRYLIFRNDLNDGVVSYQSQAGGLSEPFITPISNVLHGYAPRYPKVIQKVSVLLQGGQNKFAPAGFPLSGRRLPMEIPDPSKLSISIPPSQIRVGDEAACWSGMVPKHAYAFARIAGEENKVILARPVNPDATPLIDNDSATKGMKVKGKSSNWGPQKGYITMDQTYSKIWQQYNDEAIRQREINDYNEKVRELLDTEPNVASTRSLEIVYKECNRDSFLVYYDAGISDAEQALYLAARFDSSEIYYKWDVTDTDGCPIDEESPVSNFGNLKALQVLSNPDESLQIDGQDRYYTADYDLLAIGAYDQKIAGNVKDDCSYPMLPPFDKEKGLITEHQKKLLVTLNNAVRDDAGYEGGNVSHHGPENQFYVLDNPKKGSPYVDYPITAFYPKDKRSKEGKIMSIPRGPAGFRDIYLKRFMAEKRREGYDLYDNIHSPGWKWRFHRKYSYDRGWSDRDAPNLADSPAELPFPDYCDDNKSLAAIDDYQEELNKLLAPIVQENFEESLLFPNPTSHRISTRIISKKEDIINYKIVSQSGVTMKDGIVELNIGSNPVDIDVSHFSEGMYFLIISSAHKVISKRFIIGQ